jgi:predicted TIM-barrel fold metal-dependent hydrolase
MSTGIFAHHAHVFPESVRADGTIERLLRLLDECGIDGAVCFAPFSFQVRHAGVHPNGWLAEAIAPHSRLVGFGTIDFARHDVKDQVRQCAQLGLRGLKLHPNVQEFDVLSPRAMEVYAAAEEQGLFVTFHTGVHHSRLEDCRLLKFDEVARRFPRLRFSMEHMGGYHFFHEALAVLANHYPPPWEKRRCNVFAGLVSVFTLHQNRFWYLRPDQIMEIILQTSAEQVIFGLDFPYNLERETLIGLETIRGLGLEEADFRKILGGNLRRELGLEPAAA